MQGGMVCDLVQIYLFGEENLARDKWWADAYSVKLRRRKVCLTKVIQSQLNISVKELSANRKF